MDPEKQIPEDNEQQGSESSSNTYPGQDKKFNNRLGLNDVKGLVTGGKKLKKTGRVGQAAQKARAAAQAGSAATRAAGQAAARAAAQAAAQFAAATAASVTGISVGWLVVIVIIIIVLVFFLLKDPSVLGINTYSNQPIASSGPVFAKIGDKLDYTITLDYPAATKNIIVTDQIPQGTEYIDSPQATYNAATNTVTWNMPASSASATLSLTLLATKDNNYIINILKGTMPNGVLGINDSSISNESLTPTLFQKAPTNIQPTPSDANIIKSCVVTKVGEPAVIPSLPPECTEF
jgi:uncharacterized repeat protein (TIGR01451 family)